MTVSWPAGDVNPWKPPGPGMRAIPAPCKDAYTRYLAAMAASPLAAATQRTHRYRILGFLRWLATETPGSVAAVLSEPDAWAQATTRYATARAAADLAGPTLDSDRLALQEFAVQLSLLDRRRRVPGQWAKAYDTYVTAPRYAALSPSNRNEYAAIAARFLRWAGDNHADPVMDWADATATYTAERAASGLTPKNHALHVRALNHCGTTLGYRGPVELPLTTRNTRVREIPDSCAEIYNRYVQALGASLKVHRTQMQQLQRIRLFLVWLNADTGGDVNTVLTDDDRWDDAAARFLQLTPNRQTARGVAAALRDFALRMRIGPDRPFEGVFADISAIYTESLATSGLTPRVQTQCARLVTRFLRWARHHRVDPVTEWATATETWVSERETTGVSPEVLHQYRGVLNRCGAALGYTTRP